MNLNSQIKKLITLFLLVLFGFFANGPALVLAQESLSLTITPPLIKNSLEPGQIWKGSIKLVNNNAKEIRAYVQIKDFTSGKEDGTAVFIDKPSAGEKNYLLSDWIVINEGPYAVAAQSSEEIPFIIEVPEDASPGGHYAAILTGTKPPEVNTKGSTVKISTMLATLLLMNVNGETREEGVIREFSTDKKYYGGTNVKFTVRFENQGNIHLQPQGEIKIYDIFGKEKDSININHKTEFGNVLPQSIRKWEFNWHGEDGLLSSGRYKAELLLSFGNQGKETKQEILYFWVIKYKPLLVILFVLIAFILLLILYIRRSIKKAIKSTQELAGFKNSLHQARGAEPSGNADENKSSGPGRKNWHFLKIFFIVILLLLAVLLIIFGIAYLEDAKSFEARLANKKTEEASQSVNDQNKTEEVKPAKKAETSIASSSGADIGATSTASSSDNGKPTEQEPKKKPVNVIILNGSGQAGAASQAAERFENNGYLVIKTGNADSFDYQNTEIKFKKGFKKTAEEMLKLFDNEVKLELVAGQEEDIIVVIGQNSI